MGSHEAQNFAFLLHHEASPARAQQIFLDELLHAQIAVHSRALAGHHIGYADVLQAGGEGHGRVARSGSLQQEPADKRDPQPADPGAGEEPENPERDEQ